MSAKKQPSKSPWRDPDDAPPLDAAWFASADLVVDGAVAKRGRPAGGATKEAISIRLDKDVLAHFRAGGPGWQARINDQLRGALPARKRRAG